MNSNHLDLWFSKSKGRCCLTFTLFASLFVMTCFGMLKCSRAVFQYADASQYILLFDHPDVASFFLGRLVYNAMEYLFAGKNIVWIVLKSLSVTDVLVVMMTFIILFQDSQLRSASLMRMFTIILVIAIILILAVYSLFLAAASLQLTTEAGFLYLSMAAVYGQVASIGLIGCTAVFLMILLLK